jgi:hypothetical protein
MSRPLSSLPATFAATRDDLHAVACFVLAPARKQATGRIALTPTPGGFGTPPFGARSRCVRVEAGDLVVDEEGVPSVRRALTTVAEAAALVGIPLSADPGVGRDLPPFTPDTPLAIDPAASLALGAWYGFADEVLGELRASLEPRGPASELQLWPEHFDLAFDHQPSDGRPVNLGASPGDAVSVDPYLYVGPWERDGLADADGYWNAPFGAVLTYSALLASPTDPVEAAHAFFDRGVVLLSG